METSRKKIIGIAVAILILSILAVLAMLAERQRPPVIDEEKERLIEEIAEVENTLSEDKKEELVEEIQTVKNGLSEEEKKRLMEELNNY
jgi:hypothetical protein